jgi:two-component system chemotaxis sensor kinase CheA
MEAIKQTFFQECEEQLAELEQGLLAIQGGESDSETVNAVFRAVHSIKGGAGAFGLDDLVRFAHVFETTLDHVRSGKLAPEADLLKVMLRAADVLADLVRAARDGGKVDAARSDALLAELNAFSGGDAAAADDDDGMGDLVFQPLAFEPIALDMAPPAEAAADDFDISALLGSILPAAEEPAGQAWIVRFKPSASLYAHANESALLLRELGRMGEVEVTLDDSALPALGELEPEGSYLAWTVRLVTERDEDAIRSVFEWVEDDCELTIEKAGAAAQAAADEDFLVPDLDDPEPPLAPIPEGALDIAALIQKAQSAVGGAVGGAAEPAPVPAAAPASAAPATPANANANANTPAAANAGQAGATIRVDLDRVDRLIDLVGELVINQAMLAQRVQESGLGRSSGVVMGLDELEHLTREIQDSVMAIRAQPVKSVFQRMPRLAREVAAMTGKSVRLVTEGESCEVDKTVIERLSDPLTHMIRNAIDHGLETPDKRVAAGKAAEGVVRLSAAHRSGRIVIEVSDDGAGINRPRVKSIAADKGLIAADAVMSDEEIDNLIFMPGFSTAAEVSDISGRGVGMDVVKRSIQALGGRINVTSRPGEGSVFTLSLPLTLAVLDGMVVSAGDQTLVIPLTAIIETLQPKAGEVHVLGGGAHVISIRGGYVPLIDVGVALGYSRQPVEPTKGVVMLIEGEGGARAALVVDGIQGQRQVVIKSLEANYQPVFGIAAATILGDGRVALILDIDALVAGQKGAEPARVETLVDARSESRAALAIGG